MKYLIKLSKKFGLTISENSIDTSSANPIEIEKWLVDNGFIKSAVRVNRWKNKDCEFIFDKNIIYQLLV